MSCGKSGDLNAKSGIEVRIYFSMNESKKVENNERTKMKDGSSLHKSTV